LVLVTEFWRESPAWWLAVENTWPCSFVRSWLRFEENKWN